MKSIVSILAISFVLGGSVAAHAVTDKALTCVSGAPAMAGAAAVHPEAMVPHGKTYVFYRKGAMVGRAAGGNRWGGLRLNALNCAKILCPSTFEPGTVCWECK